MHHNLAMSKLALAISLLLTSLSPVLAAPPANDLLANATLLTGDTPTDSVSNVEATKSAGDFGERTVWWKWTAPANGQLLIDTVNSSARHIDVAVYLDDGTGGLGAKVTQHDGAYSTDPAFNLPVAQGTSLIIGVAGSSSSGNSGTVNMALNLNRTHAIGLLPVAHSATMANDAFAQRIALTGNTVSTISYNLSATTEAGEPSPSGARTFWWSYTPATTGLLTLTSTHSGAEFPNLAVYIGSSLSTLSRVAWGRSYENVSVSMWVTAGTTYQISMGTDASEWGSLVMNLALDTAASVSTLNLAHPATMANDNFANRITLAGNTLSTISYNYSATTEAGEPTPSGSRTFWWTYRPSVNGQLTINSQLSTAEFPNIAVYMGTSVSSLSRVTWGRSYENVSVSVPVTANVDYQISMGADSGETGTLVMNLSLDTEASISNLNIQHPATMANDSFAGRLTLTGDAVGAVAYNYSAGTETGEPATSGTRTFWWRYVPSATGRLSISSSLSAMADPLISVYQGTTLTGLRLVKSHTSYSLASLTFPVTAGTEYQISFGSDATSYGPIVMGLSLDKNADVSLLDIPGSATAMNDNFANRVVIPGNRVSFIGYNPGATREALEPTDSGYRTLWWSWTAVGDGLVQMDYTGSDSFSGSLFIGTGSSLGSLVKIPYSVVSSSKVQFQAVSGSEYHLALGSYYSNQSGTFVVTISGTEPPPKFSTPLTSRWLPLGATESLVVDAGVPDGSYQWFKNGSAVSGATAATLTFSPVATGTAGYFKVSATNPIGTTHGTEASIGVVNQGGGAVGVPEGGVLTLNALASAPGGVTYRWCRNGVALSDGKAGKQTTAGSGSSKLTISGFDPSSAGSYICEVAMADPQNAQIPVVGVSGVFQVTVRLKPTVADVPVPAAAVGRSFSWQLEASESPTSFMVTGLPAGLALNPTTGLVTGVPSLKINAKVRVSAKNEAGTSPVREFTIVVDAVRAGLAGTYAGLVSRQPGLNSSLGGSISATVTTGATLSGTLKLGAVSHPFKGRLEVPLTGAATALLTINRPQLPALSLDLTIDSQNETLTGFVRHGTDQAGVQARLNTWSRAKLPTAFSGAYNALLTMPAAIENEPDRPHGTGFLQLGVNATTGVVALTGRSPDGMLLTQSAILWTDGCLPVQVLLYTNKGSLHGLPQIALGGPAPVYADNRVSGEVSWLKTGPANASDRTYKAGIELTALAVDGSKWVKPAAKAMIFGMTDEPANARVEFDGGGLEEAAQASLVAQTFQLTAAHVAKMAKVQEGNPCAVNVKVSPSTGLFSGTFKLVDTNPVSSTRSVSFSGILIQHLGGGQGWFLLPELAVPPAKATTVPIWAGRVTFAVQ